MLKQDDLFIFKEYLNQNDIVQNNVKVQVLNGIKARLDKIQTDASTLITNEEISDALLAAIDSLAMVVEDSYRISLYKFQFKIITALLTKEMKTLEEIIEHGQ